MPERPLRKRKPDPKGERLSSERRHRQLVDHAARILNERGIEELHVTALAHAAGVSRPLVYRVFPTREALFRAVIEDFAADVGTRFHEALVRAFPGNVETLTRAFIEASCEAIEAKGAGPWALIDPRGVSPELARISTEIFARLLDPWRDKLAEFLGVPKRRAVNHFGIIVAAGRAGLAGWLDGSLSRAEAVTDATTTVTALLTAFASASRAEVAPAAARKTASRRARR